jgi:uncharacterized membrane protein YphA (DoxX/SURF4 family)
MNTPGPAPVPAPAAGSWTPGQIALVAARWFLGALFLYLGWKKAMDPVGFLKLVRQYNAIQTPLLLNLVAATLPWFEVFCGLLLLLGVAVRGAATLLVAMLVPFTLLILQRALALHAAGDIAFCAIKFDCGCGGGEVLICRKLIENTLLVGLSLWLAASARHRLGLRTTLLR